MSDSDNEGLIDAVDALLPALLQALEALGFIARHLHPPLIGELTEQMGPVEARLAETRATFDAAVWPEHLVPFHDHVQDAAEAARAAFAALRAAGEAPAEAGGPVFGAYRALRYLPRALESLYPVSAMLPPVSRFFLNETRRDDATLVESLAEGATREGTGVHHFGNEKGQRGTDAASCGAGSATHARRALSCCRQHRSTPPGR